MSRARDVSWVLVLIAMAFAIGYGVYRAEVDSIARHELQQELIDEQARRDILFEAVGETLLPRAVCQMPEPDKLIIRAANTPAARLLEMPREELIGYNAFAFVPPEYEDAHKRGVKKYRTGDVDLHPITIKIKTYKGNIRRVQLSVAPLTGEGQMSGRSSNGRGGEWFALKFKLLKEEK